MGTYFLWGSLGILFLFLLLGFVSGLIRGLKRASLHILFLLVSMVIAFFITKPITNAVMGISLNINGNITPLRDIIVSLLNIDAEKLPTASSFLSKIPNSIVAPLLFIVVAVVTWLVFEIIYLIVARICFGKKKVDFKKNKAHRWYGSLVGIVEGFIFMFVLFAPLTALTKTYTTLASVTTESEVGSQALEDDLKPIGDYIHEFVPSEVDEMITGYNNSVVGKIAGVGGLDKALFDGLSNFKFEGEKISLRRELLDLAETYNEFTSVYKKISSKNYPKTITVLNEDVQKVIDNGIFKTVVAGTIKEYLLSTDIDSIENLSNQLIKDILQELKTKFETEDVYAYLKHDILKVLNAADSAFSTGLIEDIANVQGSENDKIINILKLISEKSKDSKVLTKPEEIVGQIFDLNIVNDCITPILHYASDEISKALENAENDIEFGLNTTITSDDAKQTLKDSLDVIDSILNSKIDIFKLLKSDDIMSELNNLDRATLSEGLSEIGTILDKTRDLKILHFIGKDGKEQNLFDNFLKSNNFEILKDEVIDGSVNGNKDGKLTYSEFFAYIKTPVLEAKDLGLLNLNSENYNFDSALDNILDRVKLQESYLASLMLPFKDLTALELNEKVFNNIVKLLEDNVGLVSFEKVEDDEWKEELDKLENLIEYLDDDEHKIGDKTFIRYLIKEKDADMTEIVKEIKKANKVDGLIDGIIDSKIFRPLANKMFEAIDNAIADTTKINPGTNLKDYDDAKYEAQKKDLEAALKHIIKVALVDEGQTLSIEDVGEILDILKENAWNGGEKDGVFNAIFENIIWYLTGENINNNPLYNDSDGKVKVPENEYYKDAQTHIKGLLGGKTYYEVESYQTIMREVQDAVDLADKLSDSIKDLEDLTQENAGEYAEKLADVVDQYINDKGQEETEKMLDDLDKLIGENEQRDEILGHMEPETKDKLAKEIEEKLPGEENAQVVEKLKEMLGLNNRNGG